MWSVVWQVTKFCAVTGFLRQFIILKPPYNLPGLIRAQYILYINALLGKKPPHITKVIPTAPASVDNNLFILCNRSKVSPNPAQSSLHSSQADTRHVWKVWL